MGVLSSDYALGEEEVGDEKEDDSGVDEDHGGDSYPYASRVERPGDTQRRGADPSEAESEHHSTDDEFLPSTHVELEETHMAGGGA